MTVLTNLQLHFQLKQAVTQTKHCKKNDSKYGTKDYFLLHSSH